MRGGRSRRPGSGPAAPAALPAPGAAPDPGGCGIHRRGRAQQGAGCERGAPPEESRGAAAGLPERLVPGSGLPHAGPGRGQKRLYSRYDATFNAEMPLCFVLVTQKIFKLLPVLLLMFYFVSVEV